MVDGETWFNRNSLLQHKVAAEMWVGIWKNKEDFLKIKLSHIFKGVEDDLLFGGSSK